MRISEIKNAEDLEDFLSETFRDLSVVNSREDRNFIGTVAILEFEYWVFIVRKTPQGPYFAGVNLTTYVSDDIPARLQSQKVEDFLLGEIS